MDPILLATSFANIVSLMADFVAHRGAGQAKDFDEFMAWLTEERHEELKTLLQSNQRTVISIKALLNESSETILDKLISLDKTLATIVSGVSQYRELARAAYPELDLLAPQALSVLEQFYDSGATSVLEVKFQSDKLVLKFIDGKSDGTIEFPEPRFIEDDLTSLVNLGLLELNHNGSGSRIFKFKRTAAALVKRQRRT